LNSNLGVYQFSSFSGQGIEPYLEGYVPIINKVYEDFFPSDMEKFRLNPIGTIYVKESFVKKGEVQRKGQSVHIDNDMGYSFIEDDIHYDGICMAKNIPNTCVILPLGEFSIDLSPSIE
jgi:hypothetical protein